MPKRPLRTELLALTGLAALGLLLRLPYLRSDLVEVHSWRQAEVAMIARNFYQNGFDMLRPQINWAGTLPGYVGTEFPLVPFLAALLYVPFGEHVYLGRLVSMIFFAAAAVFFYLLVRKPFGARPAWFALFFFLTSPLSIYYSRTFMPDSAMLAFSLGALFFFARWVEAGTPGTYALALFCTVLALLVKIPAAHIALPMAYLAWRKHGWAMLRQRSLWTFAALSLVPAALWYSHALRLARENYPFHWFGEGLALWESGVGVLLRPFVYLEIPRNLAASVVTPAGLLLAVAGAILVARLPARSHLFHWWGAGFFVVLILGALGFRHEYYLLPLVPVAAAFAGVLCAHVLEHASTQFTPQWSRRLRIAMAATLASVLLVSYASVIARYHSELTRLLYMAGRMVDQELPADALIVAADWRNPVLIYASHRRGWHFPMGKRFTEPGPGWTPELLEDLRSQGAEFFVALVRPDVRNQQPSLFRRVLDYVGGPKQADFLDSHPEFESYLRRCYVRTLEKAPIVVYDLRSRAQGVRCRSDSQASRPRVG